MSGPSPARAASVALTCLALALIVSSTSVSRAGLALSLAPFLFVTGFLLHGVEARVFSEGPSPVAAKHFAGAAVLALLFAAGAAFFATDSSRSLAEALRQYVDARGRQSLLLQTGYCSISFMVAYCLIGSATFPLVKRYYQGPERVMALRVPSGPVVIGLQLARGLAATLVLVPLFAAGFPPEPHGWLRLAAVWAIVGALVPLLNADGWPWKLRAIHALEITIFAFVQSYVWWRLLA